MSVGKIEKLERDALLIGSYTKGGEEKVNKSGIAWALGESAIISRGRRDGRL